MNWMKRIWLGIWKRVARLFGNRKMEIGEAIDRWFEETFRQIDSKVDLATDSSNQIDRLCISALKTCHDYSRATLSLLGKGHIYPAKALMRCQCELIVKLTWILRVADDESEQAGDDAIRERIDRWRKSTYSQIIKLGEEYINAGSPSLNPKFERLIDQCRKLRDEIVPDRMPNLVQLFEALPEPYRSKMYPTLYFEFNDAVHVDLKSMDTIYQKRQEESGELERYCVAYAFNINSLVRLNYDLSIDKVKEEYRKIMRD